MKSLQLLKSFFLNAIKTYIKQNDTHREVIRNFLFIYQFDRLQTCLAQGSMRQSLECTSITAHLVKKKKMQIPKPKWKNSKLGDLY